MPAARKWERIEDLAVLHLYRGKVAHDSREVAALAAALERSRKSIGARIQAFAGLDPANPYKPSSQGHRAHAVGVGRVPRRPDGDRGGGAAGVPGDTEPVFDGAAVVCISSKARMLWIYSAFMDCIMAYKML